MTSRPRGSHHHRPPRPEPTPLQAGVPELLELRGEVVEILAQGDRSLAKVAIRPLRFVTVDTAGLHEPQLKDRVRIDARFTIEAIEPDIEPEHT